MKSTYRTSAFLFVAGLAVVAACTWFGCGKENGGGPGAGADAGGRPADAGPCKNLECQQALCPENGTTSVSGTVTIPAGTLPVYNVIVYVPNAPVEPIKHGVTCDLCAPSVTGQPITATLTGTDGKFLLPNVPVGDNIPIVVQIGKWRKQFTIPKVTACVDNPVIDTNATRLPADQSEGDIPKFAISTGNADALECIIRKLGIKDSEFTQPSGTGSINLYAGFGGANKYGPAMNGGEAIAESSEFWGNSERLMQYDITVLSCEGGQHPETKNAASLQNMFDYANRGGRILASHWHNYWFEAGPQPFPSMAVFHHQTAKIGNITADIDMSFPKGKAFAEWMMNVNASTALGKFDIIDIKRSVDEVNPVYSQRWAYSTTPKSVQYLTANTPMFDPPNPAGQCGRVLFTDLHVSADESSPGLVFPNGCNNNEMTPQEKAFIFMIFDLTSCIHPDDQPPALR